MLAESEDGWAKSLDEFKPEYAVIFEDNFNYLSKMCLLRMREAAFTMIRMAKEYGCTVILCGADVTDHYDEYLEQGADYCLLGEGEETLGELLDQLSAGRDAADGYTSDPITQHKYLYTGADPVNRVDPSGLSFGLGGQIAVGAIVGGLISAGDAYGSGAKVKDIVKAAVIGAAIGAALAPLSFVKYLGTGLGVAGIGIGAYFTYDAYAIQQNPPLAFYRGVMTALGAFALVYGYVRAMQLRNAAPKSPEEIGQILAAENAVGPDMSNAAGRTIYRHVPRKSPAYPSQKDGVVEPYGETAPDNLPIRADRHDDGYTKGSGLNKLDG